MRKNRKNRENRENPSSPLPNPSDPSIPSTQIRNPTQNVPLRVATSLISRPTHFIPRYPLANRFKSTPHPSSFYSDISPRISASASAAHSHSPICPAAPKPTRHAPRRPSFRHPHKNPPPPRAKTPPLCCY